APGGVAGGRTIRGPPSPVPFRARNSRHPGLSRGARGGRRPQATPLLWPWVRRKGPSWPQLGEGTAVSEGQHEPDEGEDQAGDDDYPLLAGHRDHLVVEADHERGQPDPGRDDVPGDNEAEREGN